MGRLVSIPRSRPGALFRAQRQRVRRRDELYAAAGGMFVPLVTIPMLIPMLLAGATWDAVLWLALMFGVVGVLVWIMLRPGPETWRCRGCGYDSRGLPNAGCCPECGTHQRPDP